jgi:hypothetical protein
MLRVFNVFGKTKVLIVIRNQLDYILSAYSNFILHGGMSNFSLWIKGQDTRFGHIFKKLKYSYLIYDYIDTFGEDNVFVIQYESLFADDGLRDFLGMFDLNLPTLNSVRLNPGRSIFGNNLLSFLNKLGLMHLSGRQTMSSYFKSNGSDRNLVKNLLIDVMIEFYEDNKLVEKMINKKLASCYFE